LLALYITTFEITKFMLKVRNITLLDTIVLKNSGIQIHGRSIPQFSITLTDGVLRVPMMATHPTRFVFMTPTKYLVYVRNDESLTILIEWIFLIIEFIQSLLKSLKETI
jgi:hypothetical protein